MGQRSRFFSSFLLFFVLIFAARSEDLDLSSFSVFIFLQRRAEIFSFFLFFASWGGDGD